MMKTDAYYLASRELAERGGFYGLRYIAPDGRIILSESDLKVMANRGVFTPEEFVTGLDVELISSERAKVLISEGHYKMRDDETEPAEETTEEVAEETDEEVADEEVSEEETAEEEANEEAEEEVVEETDNETKEDE